MLQNFSGSTLAIALVATTAGGLSPQLAVAQSAADSAVRFRVEGFAGTTTDTRPIGKEKNKDSKGLLPSMSFSYGETFKGQFDLLAAEHAGDKSVAGAAHLGFKASAHTTLGVYVSKTRIKTPAKLNSERVGLELVYQGDKTAFNWIAGHEKVGAATVVAGTIPGYTVVDTYGDKDGVFNLADVTYYPRPNWALTLGHRYGSGRHGGVAGVERAYKWQSSTVSLFAEGRFGDKAYSGAWVGLRVRFGGNGASLRAVRDQETYTNHLKDDMYGIGNSRRRTDVALPPPPPEDDDNDCVCGACYAT
ncbi:hypothetical protein [Asticcacaulis endophyticus]|uniref:Uncharacterized protein n=1 Tax=Asticcacaulis endophyticus TaxID=1395890 RepID=A0A918QFW6_9CAUL|nr:hypothetical protein [Asticcacaulis endophyticus]GGZ44993.1 hypothetical protein GCM10011273_34680 [Asticcacaulis endophyticus]